MVDQIYLVHVIGTKKFNKMHMNVVVMKILTMEN